VVLVHQQRLGSLERLDDLEPLVRLLALVVPELQALLERLERLLILEALEVPGVQDYLELLAHLLDPVVPEALLDLVYLVDQGL
jgi:hypothetical protein